MRFYEVTFIVDDQIGEESIEAEVKKIEALITDNGGKVEKVGTLGTRKFAYPIKKKEHGYYGFIQFSADPPLLPKLADSLRLNESILRYLLVTIPRKYIEKQGSSETEAESSKEG